MYVMIEITVKFIEAFLASVQFENLGLNIAKAYNWPGGMRIDDAVVRTK